MALLTVEGTYKDGKVELTDRPDHLDEASPVLVTFLAPAARPENSVPGETRDREAVRQQAFGA